MNCFAALPGTKVINADPDAVDFTVIGWVLDSTNVALPLFGGRRTGLVTGEAILHPDGTVVDPVTQQNFDDDESWRNYLEENEPYSLGISANVLKAATAEEITSRPATPSGKLALTFSGKEYAKSSFWHVAIGAHDLVFTLDGGNRAPIDKGVTKITRDEYFTLRKTLPEVKMDALLPGPEHDEPQQAEDDDSEDLI